jgi:hypothetical protein
MDYERCEEERIGGINLAEYRCVSLAERYRLSPRAENIAVISRNIISVFINVTGIFVPFPSWFMTKKGFFRKFHF